VKVVRQIGALALFVVLVAACSPVQLRTAAAAVQACDDALGSGRLVQSQLSGLALQDTTGQVIPVLWPFGYSARIGAGGVELLDETGKVVAHEGDFVQAGGGTGNDGVFAVCAGSVRLIPPPS
jgi:hypothetical protein